MGEAAVSFAVETLGKLLIEKGVFLKGVKGEVEWLRDELRRMQCFLKDAAKKQSNSDSIRNWISEIREEDAIEMFLVNVQSQSRGMVARFTYFPKYLYHLNKVGKEIESILGMGGIGKSTLASKIYNHPDVIRQFEYRVWVVVSSEFTPQDIIKQILLQLGISLDDLKSLESVDNNRENLKKELHQRLTAKRYFIVLDDVWEAAHWESLTSAFPDGGDRASRLLLTSRNQVVTMHNGYVHTMKVLDDNQSWELFLRKAFVDNTNGECPEELKDVGEEILRKCGGLPLAISLVGSLLAKKIRLKSEWEKDVREMKYHFDRRGDTNTISTILELSYQNLPPELKACFLCLAFSKEDATLKLKNLVHIWVAQGLVRQEVVGEGEVMEDVVRSYLNELISRNMIQVKDMKYDRVRSCHVHDLVRDLSIRKAKEEIDFEVVRDDGNSHQSLGDKPRHRAINCSRLSLIYSTNRNQYLRSLFIHDGVYGPSSSYWKSFELLRVLDMGLVVLKRLPEAIGRLTGLRYLKLYCLALYGMKLPRSWANLKNLEVLHLKGYCGSYVIIDKVIAKMDSLRHLEHMKRMRNIKIEENAMPELEQLIVSLRKFEH